MNELTQSFRFAAFDWIFLLILPISFLVFRYWTERNIKRTLDKKTVSFLLGCVFMILGLMRPQIGHYQFEKKIKTGNIFVLVDLSRSMLTPDVLPTRLDYAKKWLEEFFKQIPEMKVALFPFTTQGYLQVPLTLDTNSILESLDNLDPNLMLYPGTNFTRVLNTLSLDIERAEGQSKKENLTWYSPQVLLISDGETHSTVDENLFRYYNQKKISIFTMPVGTVEGGEVPANLDPFSLSRLSFRNQNREKITSHLNIESLKKIAQGTGGQVVSSKMQDIPHVIDLLASNQNYQRKDSLFKVAKEGFIFCVLLGFLFFMLSFHLQKWQLVLNSLILMLCFGSLPAQAGSRKTVVQNYNRGVELLREEKNDDAINSFQQVIGDTQDAELLKKSYFDLGNAYFKKLDFSQALESYQKAYETEWKNKESAEANHRISENLLLTSKIIERLKQQAQGNGKKGDGKDSKDQKGPLQFSAEPLTDKEKKQFYDLIKSEEQQTFERLESQKNIKEAPSKNETPW